MTHKKMKHRERVMLDEDLYINPLSSSVHKGEKFITLAATLAALVSGAYMSGRSPMTMAVTMLKTFTGRDIARIFDHNQIGRLVFNRTGIPVQVTAKLLYDAKMRLRSKKFQHIFGRINPEDIPTDPISRVHYAFTQAQERGYDPSELDLSDDLGLNDTEVLIARDILDDGEVNNSTGSNVLFGDEVDKKVR